MGDNVVNSQKKVSTYLYPPYHKKIQTKTEYLNVNLDCFLILNIRYLTFAVKLITY